MTDLCQAIKFISCWEDLIIFKRTVVLVTYLWLFSCSHQITHPDGWLILKFLCDLRKWRWWKHNWSCNTLSWPANIALYREEVPRTYVCQSLKKSGSSNSYSQSLYQIYALFCDYCGRNLVLCRWSAKNLKIASFSPSLLN